jgi:ABC-type cobalamin/Fe3+-siderophores transport system ATPase subunit
MELDVTLKNYRCFSDARPVTIELRRGLTAFVGPNNSGKSALLRFFFEFRPFFDQVRDLGHWQGLVRGEAKNINPPSEVLDFEELFSFTNNREIEVRVAPKGTELEHHAPTLIVPRLSQSMRLDLANIPPRVNRSIHVSTQGVRSLSIGDLTLPFSEFQDAFVALLDAIYIGAFRNALNKGGANQKYFDVSIGEQFISDWADYQTGNVKRLNNAAARVVEHVRQIFGFETLAITASPKNQSLNFVINGRPLKDHEVGSGLTQILMVLAAAAVKNPTYILIDEPELNLHPALQAKFLLALASYAREGVLFGTHSIGLARTVADRIFAVQQLKEGHSEIREFDDTRNLAELMGEMSFSAYKEMGFESVLLVEGRTEVRTVQQFLRLLGKDHKVVPVPLGGSSMICPDAEHELYELKRLCGSIHAVIDSERTSQDAAIEPRRTGFADVCRGIGINCKILDRRATENYLPASAIARAFPNHGYNELGPYERLGECQPAWGKTENWRIASEMTREELLSTDMGMFLDGI